MFPAALPSKIWPTASSLWRTGLLARAGPWTGLRSNEDWEYDCRAASLGVRLHHVNEYAVDVRAHEHERTTGIEKSRRLVNRTEAREPVFGHAERAGLDETCPEMVQFACDTLLLSVKCGAAGLTAESRRMYHLARKAYGRRWGESWKFRFYESLVRTFGARWTSVLVQHYAQRKHTKQGSTHRKEK